MLYSILFYSDNTILIKFCSTQLCSIMFVPFFHILFYYDETLF